MWVCTRFNVQLHILNKQLMQRNKDVFACVYCLLLIYKLDEYIQLKKTSDPSHLSQYYGMV